MKKTFTGWTIGAMAFISGVTLGVAAGILCAPQSGRRTREDLKDMTADKLDQAGEWIDSTKETVSEFLKREKTAVGDA